MLESMNCRRTSWSPLNRCIALRESHLWQLPTSEKGIKVASRGYVAFSSHHFQGCQLSHVEGMRHYRLISVLMSSECLFKNQINSKRWATLPCIFHLGSQLSCYYLLNHTNYSQNWNCGHQDIKVINHKVTKDCSTVAVANSKMYLAEVETEI